MRFLLILLVVLAVVWLWRSARQADPKPKQPKPPTAAAPLEMVRCTLCSVHLPAADAVAGKKGPYCCTEHRQRAEP